MRIGCQFHSIADWDKFDPSDITRMGGRGADKIWETRKPVLFALIDADKRR